MLKRGEDLLVVVGECYCCQMKVWADATATQPLQRSLGGQRSADRANRDNNNNNTETTNRGQIERARVRSSAIADSSGIVGQ